MIQPLLDAALRGALITLLLLTAVRLGRDRFDLPAARVGVLLLCGLVVQTVVSAPPMEHSGPWWWQAPLVAVSVGNSVLFWVFAQALFDDGFALQRRHVVSWLAVLALGLVFFAAVVMPQRRELEAFPLAVAIAMRWVPLVFAALAVWAVASQWRADLVERRRRLRGFVLAAGAVYTVATAAARLWSDDGRLWPWVATLDTALLLCIVGPLATRLLRVTDADLLLAPRAAPVGGLPAAGVHPALVDAPAQADVPPPPDPADERLAADLQRAMREQHLYRSEDLTVASLAAHLKAPEYRLRRVINQHMGHRNFNAYVNGFRLDEARRALADPAQRERPVLTIALASGFQSIGPFNRAFKAATGLTPSEFRRQSLADS